MLRTAISMLAFTATFAAPYLHAAQSPPIPRLLVAIESGEAGVRYRYRLLHSPASVQLPDITGLSVGVAENEEAPPALKDVPAFVASPENWLPDVIKWEHAEGFHVQWTRAGSSSLPTGSALCGFEIVMPQAADALRNGPFSVWLGNGSVVSFQIEQVPSAELGCAAGSPTAVVEAHHRLGEWPGVEVGASDTLPLVYSNRSNVSVSAPLSVEGPMFSLVGPSTLTLGPGGEGTVTVRFSPTAPGMQMGMLRLTGVVGADTPLEGIGLAAGQTPVAFEPLVSETHSGLAEERREVVRDETAWARLWDEISAIVTPQPSRPAVDLARDMLVVAATGTRPSGGFAVQVTGVMQRGTDLEVTVLETCPPPGARVSRALTRPVVVVRVPRLALVPRFVETRSASRR
jgi:hypothetical protein